MENEQNRQLRELPANELRALFFRDMEAFITALENEETNLLRWGKDATYLPVQQDYTPLDFPVA